jgi:hypothetical protein
MPIAQEGTRRIARWPPASTSEGRAISLISDQNDGRKARSFDWTWGSMSSRMAGAKDRCRAPPRPALTYPSPWSRRCSTSRPLQRIGESLVTQFPARCRFILSFGAGGGARSRNPCAPARGGESHGMGASSAGSRSHVPKAFLAYTHEAHLRRARRVRDARSLPFTPSSPSCSPIATTRGAGLARDDRDAAGALRRPVRRRAPMIFIASPRI